MAVAFLVTEVFTGLLMYNVSRMIWSIYPDLPVSASRLLGNMAMLLGSAFLCLIANHTSVPLKFDRPAFLTLVVGLVASYALISLTKPLFGSGQLNFAEWDLLYLFVCIGFGPVVEEILVRGCYFEVLRRSWGDRSALKISTALFVLPHVIWGGFQYLHPFSILSLTLSSLLYTCLYIVGGLVPAIGAHMFWNFYVLLLW